ncbi:MAG: exported protein of unknown function [Candidatus Saccharibacteria bacterium]|nr:exported protein of unknown function [Candidatus Saccharibacteria bacterium]
MLAVLLVLFILLFLGAGGFGIWAYQGKQDYKNNVMPKINAAVAIAKKETETAKDNEFQEKEKYPLRSYAGPGAYGAPTVSYPKTWSAYVNESGNGSAPVDAYFHPSFVPAASLSVSYAIRLQVIPTAYDQVLKQFDSYVKLGTVKVTPYSFPKVSSIVGARLDGEIISKKSGSMVIIPLRDKTLKIWTESPQFVPDFNNIILPNFSFIP